MDCSNPKPYSYLLEIKERGYIFRFTTLNGSEYIAYFILMPIDSGICYSFNFERGGEKENDRRVYDTLISILHHYFENISTVLIYTCDTSDGKHPSRFRLFDLWFKRSKANLTLKKKEIIINNIYYNAILYRQDEPLWKEITDEITELTLSICD